MRAIPLFALGRLLITPGALTACEVHRIDCVTLIARHVCGEWGELCEEDKRANELALLRGERILSAYRIEPLQPGSSPVKLWVITEADRSATTVLLPKEY